MPIHTHTQIFPSVSIFINNKVETATKDELSIVFTIPYHGFSLPNEVKTICNRKWNHCLK